MPCGCPPGGGGQRPRKKGGPAVTPGPPQTYEERELGVPQVRGGVLAALVDHVVADLLALAERAHPGALDGRDMDEHVLGAVARLDEAKAFSGVEEFHSACSHR